MRGEHPLASNQLRFRMDDNNIANAVAGDGGFLNLGLDPALVASVAALGYEEPTDIQREAIPPLIAGRDVLGQAATGTGKTRPVRRRRPCRPRSHPGADA
jgi:superfamily II DNA/RNA helicase